MLKHLILMLLVFVPIVHANEPQNKTGYLANAKQVGENVWIGPQPSAADFNEFAAEEVTVVVNTRTQAEVDQLDYNQAEQAGQFNMAYDLIEIGNGHAYSPAQLADFNTLMQANVGEKMVLHCKSGNRASQLYAAWLIKHQDKSIAEALQAIQSDETTLNDSIKALLGQ